MPGGPQALSGVFRAEHTPKPASWGELTSLTGAFGGWSWLDLWCRSCRQLLQSRRGVAEQGLEVNTAGLQWGHAGEGVETAARWFGAESGGAESGAQAQLG